MVFMHGMAGQWSWSPGGVVVLLGLAVTDAGVGTVVPFITAGDGFLPEILQEDVKCEIYRELNIFIVGLSSFSAGI